MAECSDPLLRTAYLIAWDLPEAEDLVQECLLTVARRWPRVRRMEHPRAYARRVLVNLALDDRRHRARRRQELAAMGTAVEPGADEDRRIAGVEIRRDLVDALATLPPRQRAVLVLRYFEDLPEAQVATVLGCSVGTVKSTASRGLARLQTSLEPEPTKERTP